MDHDDEAPGAAPRVPELSALLADIDELRLVLSADLGLAASAVELGAHDIAADVLAGGRAELADFAARAAESLGVPAQEQPAEAAAAAAPSADVLPLVPRARRRLRRTLLPTAPALAAAAALVGVLAGVVPAPSSSPEQAQPTAAAMASYADLWRLHLHGAPVPALREASRELHAHVARLVAAAPEDPEVAAEALRLLELEAAVLDGSEHREQLLDALAETRRLVAALRAALEDVAPGQTARPAPRRVRPSAVPLPLPTLLPPAPSASAPPQETSSPSPAATPSSPAPSRTPASTEEPKSSPTPGPLFPTAGAPLGWDVGGG